MANKTEERLRHRKIASILMIAAFLILFFVVTPIREPSLLRSAGMAAAFLLFPASVYFNFKSRAESNFTLPLWQSIAILVAFLALAWAMSFFS